MSAITGRNKSAIVHSAHVNEAWCQASLQASRTIVRDQIEKSASNGLVHERTTGAQQPEASQHHVRLMITSQAKHALEDVASEELPKQE